MSLWRFGISIGALSITTISKLTLSIGTKKYKTQTMVILIVVILNVVFDLCLNQIFVLGVVMPNDVMLSVVASLLHQSLINIRKLFRGLGNRNQLKGKEISVFFHFYRKIDDR